MTNRQEQERALAQAMENATEIHRLTPSMYYLGEGDPEKVKDCRKVFKLMKPIAVDASHDYFSSDQTIPLHPLFSQVWQHIARVKNAYKGKENLLTHLFVSKMLPSNPLPLRFDVLSSISLFSTRVYLHKEALRPAPLHAYIDGYFHFVVNLGESVLRIPLLVDSSDGEQQFQKCPASLRFAGASADDGDGHQTVADYVFNVAPKTGRRTQFHTFISVLNSGKPIDDFLPSFMNALVSFDCSFATAICALASDPGNLVTIRDLFNILAASGMLDHFLRSIGAALKGLVSARVVQEVTELFALNNMFLAQCHEWSHSLASKYRSMERPRLESMVADICDDICDNRFGGEAMYILKALIAIAAYQDKDGVAALSMFLEILVRPFVIGLGLGNEYGTFKEQIGKNGKDVRPTRLRMEETIVTILTADVKFFYCCQEIEEQLFEIHNFVTQNLDEFVRLVISLNNRKKSDHPAVQMITFAFHKCKELNLF